MAETLKYFYLIFSEPDVMSLDDYVFNTEAHGFKLPKSQKKAEQKQEKKPEAQQKTEDKKEEVPAKKKDEKPKAPGRR
jgi:hypothetical protein